MPKLWHQWGDSYKNKRICTKRAPKVDTPVVHFFLLIDFVVYLIEKKTDASLFIAQYNNHYCRRY